MPNPTADPTTTKNESVAPEPKSKVKSHGGILRLLFLIGKIFFILIGGLFKVVAVLISALFKVVALIIAWFLTLVAQFFVWLLYLAATAAIFISLVLIIYFLNSNIGDQSAYNWYALVDKNDPKICVSLNLIGAGEGIYTPSQLASTFRQGGFDTTLTSIYDSKYPLNGPWNYEGEVLTIEALGTTDHMNLYTSKDYCEQALSSGNYVK